ncbi:hypothetical protein P4493_32690 [Bacillus thuringiensis]|jgi:hypothetical protein|uniref:Uncharacterized protein n=3 Tax=Bacillus thuringiensis TaxID=1428 RepID=A0AAW9JPT2_BACTU|nr:MULTISPECIES: hypothetical protein [Bacillus]MED1157939.1 hypothetical protein [Bacillus paranthracis]AFQ30512.1 hypothetical protein BTF1_32136 [Bacillus thuringiensis HD-789]AND28734.1 hypothetical protein ATN07_34045 [Bacillus thuringiensis serovar israelensis]ASO64487.1 hypothetical protein [Bacillus thuringiensis serovar israelensis]EEM99026.1 hypothetical protein bthur0014_63620 [Bacillus thuringiensis IBL 4222]
MDTFRDKLRLGAIDINQNDKNGVFLRQFDEVRYKEEKYIIIWHPIYEEFVASHHTRKFIPYELLNRVEYKKNLKENVPK